MMIARSVFWTYGLAFLGVHLAFMPLLVLLLPRRVEALALQDGPEGTAVFLSILLLTGGLVAGLSNILAGALSDRWMARFGNRRGLIAIGAGLVLSAYVGFACVGSKAGLFASVIYFQIALNCCFAPLGVLLADHFPDNVKGRLSGLSNAALPTSTLLVAPIAWAFPEDSPYAFILVGALSAGCMIPLLASWNLPEAIANDARALSADTTQSPHRARDFTFAWTARLLVQTGAAFTIGYIYLYIQETGIAQLAWKGAGASEVLAALTAPAAGLAIAATLLGGTLSDRKSTRRVPLLLFACVLGLGLGVLAGLPELGWFFVAYGLFQIGLAGFLSVDTAMVAQLVAGSARRGLWLGVMNLSNTLPSIIAPSIALLALGAGDISGALPTLFAIFAVAAFVAGFLMLLIRSVR